MRLLRMWVVAVLMGVLPLTQAGCLLLLAGAGAATGIVYANGKLEGYTKADVEKTAVAAKGVLEDLKCMIVTYHASKVDGEVTGRSPDDRVYNVEIRYDTDTSSRIFIRVGSFGDEALSRMVLQRIQERL